MTTLTQPHRTRGHRPGDRVPLTDITICIQPTPGIEPEVGGLFAPMSTPRLTPRSKGMAYWRCVTAKATDRCGRAARDGISPSDRRSLIMIVAQSDAHAIWQADRRAYSPALLRNALESWTMILRPSMLIEPRAASVCRTRFTAGRDAPTICASSVWVRPRSTGTP